MRNTTWYYLARPLFLKVTEKEAGQQLSEGVALARSAQVMEIQGYGL